MAKSTDKPTEVTVEIEGRLDRFGTALRRKLGLPLLVAGTIAATAAVTSAITNPDGIARSVLSSALPKVLTAKEEAQQKQVAIEEARVAKHAEIETQRAALLAQIEEKKAAIIKGAGEKEKADLANIPAAMEAAIRGVETWAAEAHQAVDNWETVIKDGAYFDAEGNNPLLQTLKSGIPPEQLAKIRIGQEGVNLSAYPWAEALQAAQTQIESDFLIAEDGTYTLKGGTSLKSMQAVLVKQEAAVLDGSDAADAKIEEVKNAQLAALPSAEARREAIRLEAMSTRENAEALARKALKADELEAGFLAAEAKADMEAQLAHKQADQEAQAKMGLNANITDQALPDGWYPVTEAIGDCHDPMNAANELCVAHANNMIGDCTAETANAVSRVEVDCSGRMPVSAVLYSCVDGAVQTNYGLPTIKKLSSPPDVRELCARVDGAWVAEVKNQ